MKITWLGHACFTIEGSKKIIIDPFLSGNPVAPKTYHEIEADYVLLTHGHGDHLGDAVEISQERNATLIAPFELATFCGQKGAQVHGMHLGGAFQFDGVKIKLTPAFHGSGFVDGNSIYYTGNPCGYLIWMDDKCLYHAGDTGLFGDMNFVIGKFNTIDVAFLPIGDNFTMGPDDALIAADWLKAKTVVPMHYNTWPLIQQDPELFKKAVETKTTSKCCVLKLGESFEL